jgi:hypothetical protein
VKSKVLLLLLSVVIKLDFISQLFSNSTFPFVGLQHMQQAKVNFPQFCVYAFDPNEWYMKNGLKQCSRGFKPKLSSLLSWIFNP